LTERGPCLLSDREKGVAAVNDLGGPMLFAHLRPATMWWR